MIRFPFPFFFRSPIFVVTIDSKINIDATRSKSSREQDEKRGRIGHETPWRRNGGGAGRVEEKGEKWGAREEMFESWQLTRIGSVELYLYDSLASHSARQ